MADEVTITVRPDGNYRVEGPFKLVDNDGNEYSLEQADFAVLCRCGQSGNKPFCDGSHRTTEFKAESTAR